MTGAPHSPPACRGRTTRSAGESRLVRCLERHAIPAAAGRRARITRVWRSPARSATSYGAEVVYARLADGAEMRFFLKDYGSSRRPRPAPARRRERERGVYRHLVGGGEIGTARYCGAVWDDDAPVHWLLLEFVAGAQLRHMELTYWVEAARWLGRMQGRFAGVPTPSALRPVLERHDAEFFGDRAEGARRSVSHRTAAMARRLEAILIPYERSIDLMAGEPPGFVHGHFEAANILVSASADRVRICPVDWELAAIGSRFFDLAALCDGFDPPELDRIWDAYGEGAEGAGLTAPPRDRLRRLVDCFRLFRVVGWLASAARKRYPQSGVERLLERGEGLVPLVGS